MSLFPKSLSAMDDHREPAIKRMRVSPQQARWWLDSQNSHNRRMVESVWRAYARDMEAGRWKFNGDTIRFDRDGILIDGQHRLKACAETGIPLDTLVVTGLDREEVMPTCDIGSIRTAAQIGDIDGIANSTRAAAIALRVIGYRSKYGLSILKNAHLRPTKTEVTEFMRSDARLRSVASHAHLASGLMPPGMAGLCYYVFSEKFPIPLVDEFFSALSTGVGLSAKHPIYLLRERLLRNRSERAKLPQIDIAALTFKAFKAFAAGKSMNVLRWTNEAFPEL